MNDQQALQQEIAELEEIQEFLNQLLPELEQTMESYDLSMAETINTYTNKIDRIEKKAQDLKENTKQQVTARRQVAAA